MKFFAVTGNPILFSKSPELFNSIFRAKKIEAYYFRLAAQSAKEAIDLFKELGLSGMSVTAPFKSDIIPYLDQIDQIAQEIGAVNTVINKNGKLIGYNTDYYGIVDSLGEIKNKKVLLIGAGGAAQAVAYSISKKGGALTIFNRTSAKAELLAQKYKANICSKDNLQAYCKNTDIIINTLPSGIKILEDSSFHQQQIIFDAIYHNSVYQAIAKQVGAEFLSGELWLKNQAIPAFKLFFEKEDLSFDEIEIPAKKPKSKLIFTGFMASGKSVVGKAFSQEIKYNFYSTDDKIAANEGLSISQIFEKYGESYFREKEQKVLSNLSEIKENAVVSSGGGLILDAQNRKLISDNFLSIFLYANTQSIANRAKTANRPLLKDNPTAIQDLMQQRKNFYLQSCDILINTNNKTIGEIVELLSEEFVSLYK